MERKSFLLRLDPAVYAAVERWAHQELRSVNGQIEFLLKQAVLARDKRAFPTAGESAETGKDS
ncbi:MAG: hypothetical protein NT069_28030 [Planctomycetota bacterium]|nr:hypothetical protein [Planctomycetota bacterium]